MCNRYRMTAKQADVARALGVELPFLDDVTLPPPELFPKKPAWVARSSDAGRRLDVMTWGFPHVVTGASGKSLNKPVTNVRNLASPFWRSALVNPERRCLIAVTSFSEYGPGLPGKMPLFWFDVPSRPIFAFAGIWRPIAGELAAFAFLTTEPNPLVAPIHPKAMPVILHVDDYDRWLTGSLGDVSDLVAPYPSQLMTVAGSADAVERSA